MRSGSLTDDDAVFAYLDVVPDSGCFDDGVRANVNVVSDLHWVVIEVSSVCLVRWSIKYQVSSTESRMISVITMQMTSCFDVRGIT